MLSVEAALDLVLGHARPLPPRPYELAAGLGRVLAESIVADIDSPPHDKALVDGYAVLAADLRDASTDLTVLEEVTAGCVPKRELESGTATRIMTGAPLPAGADAVVMVEQTEAVGDRVRILQSPVKRGQNIMRRAASLTQGEAVLSPGQRLRAIEIGLLAEVGRAEVLAIPAPRVAVLSTGNELVEPSRVPAAGQIRNSNGPLVAALVAQAGGEAVALGIARDERDQLRGKIQAGLAYDILLISGGVSAGVLDLVPQVLADLGVRQVFHKLSLKPGKPLWFGLKEQTLVFGLPGNPVSSLVCFELFVRPGIEKLSGREPRGLARHKAILMSDHQQRGERPTYWPAIVKPVQERAPAQESAVVTPLAWQGSGDLRTLTSANGLAYFPAGDRLFAAGEPIDVLLLPEP